MIEQTKNLLTRMKFYGMLETVDIRLSEAISHGVPWRRARTALTSSRDSTAGTRTGRRARTISASHGSLRPRTSL